jgi:hypothetical protein
MLRLPIMRVNKRARCAPSKNWHDRRRRRELQVLLLPPERDHAPECGLFHVLSRTSCAGQWRTDRHDRCCKRNPTLASSISRRGRLILQTAVEVGCC